MENNEEEFSLVSVKDLGLASYIFANEIKPHRVDQRGNTVFFLFPKDRAESLVNSYWNDLPPFLSARQLFAAQRSLKDQIFNLVSMEKGGEKNG